RGTIAGVCKRCESTRSSAGMAAAPHVPRAPPATWLKGRWTAGRRSGAGCHLPLLAFARVGDHDPHLGELLAQPVRARVVLRPPRQLALLEQPGRPFRELAAVRGRRSAELQAEDPVPVQ